MFCMHFCFPTLGINRQKAQEWCIKHGFELVELSPEELPDEDGRTATSVLTYRMKEHTKVSSTQLQGA